AAVRRKLGYMSEEREAELYDVFLGCCQVAEIERRDRASEIDLTDPKHIFVGIPDDFNIRNDFPEMWFNEIVNTGHTGSVRLSYTTPGSITEWSVQAVGLTNNF
ncbi:hypothetical protein, partial [Salmonella sp. s51944]|uniref:hypothetical protein n=1 Tax=Salmonella sp. s51944 TaxID=3159655 RepID=UPI0039803EAA